MDIKTHRTFESNTLLLLVFHLLLFLFFLLLQILSVHFGLFLLILIPHLPFRLMSLSLLFVLLFLHGRFFTYPTISSSLFSFFRSYILLISTPLLLLLLPPPPLLSFLLHSIFSIPFFSFSSSSSSSTSHRITLPLH